jgi:hypothetical protein
VGTYITRLKKKKMLILDSMTYSVWTSWVMTKIGYEEQ